MRTEFVSEEKVVREGILNSLHEHGCLDAEVWSVGEAEQVGDRVEYKATVAVTPTGPLLLMSFRGRMVGE